MGSRLPTLALLAGLTGLWAGAGSPAPARAHEVAGFEGLELGGERYQQELVDSARARHRLELETEPEGKIVERIVTVPYDVFLDNDPYPMLANWLHVTTLPQVVERELLFKVGDVWDKDRVRESGRNLRTNDYTHLYVATAQIVACKGSAPDRVVALIVTKDLWSLRPNAQFQFVGSQLQYVQAELTEENFLGRNKRVTVDLGLDLAVYYAGLQYRDPRLMGTRLSMLEKADLIWNRDSGKVEGGVIDLTVQRPLFSLDSQWSWIASVQYRKDIYRLFSGGALAQFESPTTGERIPYRFNRHVTDYQLGVTRSVGRATKRDYSAGYRGFMRRYDVPASDLALQPATQSDFESAFLPRTENAGMLYVGFRAYDASYRELLDIQTYALTEDYRIGLDFASELRFASPAFGFSSTYAQPVLRLTWTAHEGDDLFIAESRIEARYQPQLSEDRPWANAIATVVLKNVSPRFSIFRLHNGVQLGRRYNDFTRGFATLGGENNLRGYPVAYLIGQNYWVTNAELRTAPLPLWTAHLGAAAFVDVGSAANSVAELTPHGSAGAGLRIGFPQFNREILRLDFGFPLERIEGATPSYFVMQYGQAF